MQNKSTTDFYHGNIKDSMQALRELVYIVKNNRLPEIELLETKAGNKSNLIEFYQGILANQFLDDDAAAQYFYNSDKQQSGYQKLKANLKTRLLNHLFFIDTRHPSYTDRQRAYYTCYKEWAAAKILIGKNARLAGVALCHSILKQAKRFEFTDLMVEVTKNLRLHYGTREGNLKKYEKYNALFKQYNEINQWEDVAEELYIELNVRFVNSKSTDTVVQEKAREYLAQLAEPLRQFDTYRLHLCAKLIQLVIYSGGNEFEQTIKVCENAIRFFEAKKYTASVPLQIFYYQKLICHTQLKQYEAGKAAAEKCLEFLEEGSFNWFNYQQLYLNLSLHTRNYQEAYHIALATVAHKRFQFLPENIRETWRIYEAYIHYLITIGKVKRDKEEVRFSNFRLGKFLNTTTIFSKDKRGLNIPILVAQIVFMIVQRKYGQAIDRIEAIEKYCSRYLMRDDTYRSNCFIKMLLQIPICSFHRSAVERKTEKYRKKLAAVPLNVAKQTHEVEIIPYEDLWEMVIKSMEYEFYKPRGLAARARAGSGR